MGVLGVIYQLGPDVDVGKASDQSRLGDQLRAARWDDTGEPVYNLPVALSIMVFFALCAQCAATLAVIRRETNSWRWPAFTFAVHDGARVRRRTGDVSDRHSLARIVGISHTHARHPCHLDRRRRRRLFLARQAWLRFRAAQGGSCGSCSNCRSNDSHHITASCHNLVDVSHAKAQRRRV